jgi:hypothetical protein
MTSNTHDCKAKDAERQALQRQLDEWAAKGNIPLIIPTTKEPKNGN